MTTATTLVFAAYGQATGDDADDERLRKSVGIVEVYRASDLSRPIALCSDMSLPEAVERLAPDGTDFTYHPAWNQYEVALAITVPRDIR